MENKIMTMLTQSASARSIKPNVAMPDLSDFITTKEAAKALGFHMSSVQKMLKNKVLVGVKVGHTWLISKQSIAEYKADTKTFSKNDPRRGRKKKPT
jgi:excisionase family DNA binding protein